MRVVFEGCMIYRNGGELVIRGPERLISYMFRVFLQWLGVFFDCLPNNNMQQSGSVNYKKKENVLPHAGLEPAASRYGVHEIHEITRSLALYH